MKRNLWFIFYGAEAAICLALVALSFSVTDIFSSLMAFPFEQLGLGLRVLSLWNAFGNVVAIVIYMAVCLSPIAVLMWRKKQGLSIEDWLLVVISILLFVVLYQMINPALITLWPLSGDGITVAKAILGGCVYSVILAYVVLKVLRLFYKGQVETLQKYMRFLLYLLNAQFVYLIFGAGVSRLMDSITALQQGNLGNEHLLGTTYMFFALQFLVNNIPFALNIAVVCAAISLLSEVAIDRYSTSSVLSAERLSRLCGFALTITVISNVGFNILQLLFSKVIMTSNYSLEVPLFSVIFVLATLLLSRFIAENKVLKDDNDSFI